MARLQENRAKVILAKVSLDKIKAWEIVEYYLRPKKVCGSTNGTTVSRVGRSVGRIFFFRNHDVQKFLLAHFSLAKITLAHCSLGCFLNTLAPTTHSLFPRGPTPPPCLDPQHMTG